MLIVRPTYSFTFQIQHTNLLFFFFTVLVIGTINQGLQELIDSLGRLYGVLEEEMLEI